MPNNALDMIERNMLRRPDNFEFFTGDQATIEAAKTALFAGTIHEVYDVSLGLFIRGYVLSLTTQVRIDSRVIVKIVIRPVSEETGRSRCRRNTEEPVIGKLVIDQWKALKEDSMKVYEGIIVKLDEQGQATEVLKVIAPFVAKDATQAVDAIRTDYAIENKLSGKDAAALRVRVREFPIG